MANGHGGQRQGAGRKPNAERYSDQLGKANDHLAYELRECVVALLELALGKTWEEKWVPAGTLLKKDVLRLPEREGGWTDGDGKAVNADGTPLAARPEDGIWRDDKGKPAIIDVPAYPELEPDALVLVERKRARPDIKALQYIWDRLEGRPNYVLPPEPHVLDIRQALSDAVAAVAARKARPSQSDDPPPEPATAEEAGDDDDGD